MRNSVGRYELLNELGRGGMATVFLANQIDLDRLVALKELAALRRSDPSFAERFLREARLAGSVTHPNVVTVYDLFANEGTPYIAMEYVERGSLRPYVGRMSLAHVGGVLEAVLAGLAAAEKQSIVHRDLKPENLLVTANGRVKISDFGIAKATNALTGPTLTSQGAAVGTPNYMAPEQALAQELGPWTDLYSVGIIAFEFFIGLTPFGDTQEPMAVVLRQVNEAIPPVNDLDPGIDPRIAGWIDWLVTKEPSGRPQSAEAAWDKLEDALIALLGPRWRRDSRLPPLPDAPAVLPGPATPPPPGAPGGPLTEAHLGALFDVATSPHGQAQSAATVPPRAPAAEEPAPAKPRRRRGGSWKLVFAAVAAIAIAAAVLGRSGSGTQPASSTLPSSAGAPAAAATPASSGQSGAVGGVQQIQGRSPRGGTLSAQASDARALAQRYDGAAAQVAALKSAQVSGSPGARLVVALRQTASDYRRAANAASAGDVAGYEAALAHVDTSKQAVDATLAEMGATAPQSPVSPLSGNQPTSPCSGDSSSDDPSDDSCSP